MSESAPARLQAARALLDAGAVGRAIAALRETIAEFPELADAQALLGEALEASGDRVGAETALRAALAIQPDCLAAAVRLAGLLTPRRRAAEAVAILGPLADHPSADVKLLTALGLALKTVGRQDDAVDAYRRAAELAPADAAAQHNLAGALGDAHRFADSLAATRRAFELDSDVPETWLVRGRSLFGLGEYDDAERAFGEAIARHPTYADAHAELAQLKWMRTEDVAAAVEEIDRALALAPGDAQLSLAKARVLEYAGEAEAAYDTLAAPLKTQPGHLALQVGAAQLMLSLDADLAITHAQKAYDMAPDSGPAASMLCQADLALGRADAAARLAEGLMRDWPLDQHPVTLAATAWRIMDDPRYPALYDYDRLVVRRSIDTPAGWPTLGAYLEDLAASLRALHRMRAHPIGQSLRHGVQTGGSLTRSDDPAIKAFFAAIDPIIRSYIARLGERDDVLGRRVTAGYRFSGAWSALLRPGGHHVDHIHPLGWISSAFHVELPEAIEDGHQGWLKFGQPGLVTTPILGPERFEKPRAGDLVLFPSYMWHGTVPFGGEKPRLAIAFDVVPA
ncbi:MAG: putative 2OG-Fe(II) oxygenase [Caulobacteraceae bacterium]